MPRCVTCGQASATCGCVLQGSANVVITGTGSSLDPFVIDVPGGGEGPPGPPGKSTSILPYVFDTSTVAPPASGTVQLNNANQTQATVIRMNFVNAEGDNLSALPFVIGKDDFISLQSVPRPTTGAERYTVTGAPVSQTGYMDIPVAWHSGALPLTDDEPITMNVIYVGSEGPAGPEGPVGPRGPGMFSGSGAPMTKFYNPNIYPVADEFSNNTGKKIQLDSFLKAKVNLAVDPALRHIVSNWGTFPGSDQKGWRLYRENDALKFGWSNDLGATTHSLEIIPAARMTALAGTDTGKGVWIGARLYVANPGNPNGAGNATIHGVSSVDGVTWVDEAIVHGDAPIQTQDTGRTLAIGYDSSSTAIDHWNSGIYWVQMVDNADPNASGPNTMFKFDPNEYPGSGDTWVDSFGRVWLVQGAGGNGSLTFGSNSVSVIDGVQTLPGDMYLNEDNGDLYQKDGSGNWVLIGNLEGPQGPQGPQGAQGPQGPAGGGGGAGRQWNIQTYDPNAGLGAGASNYWVNTTTGQYWKRDPADADWIFLGYLPQTAVLGSTFRRATVDPQDTDTDQNTYWLNDSSRTLFFRGASGAWHAVGVLAPMPKETDIGKVLKVGANGKLRWGHDA